MTITLEQARAVIEAHAAKETAEKHAAVEAACLGRFFKYRNSYSLATEEQRWWMYFAVMHVEDYTASCRGLEFQQDNDGVITVNPDGHHYVFNAMGRGGWIEISRAEFTNAALIISTAATNLLDTLPPRVLSESVRPARKRAKRTR